MVKISYTQHALDVMAERMISKELVESTVINPDWEESEAAEIWNAFRRIHRKVLRVVIKGRKSHIVITTYYDRRKK